MPDKNKTTSPVRPSSRTASQTEQRPEKCWTCGEINEDAAHNCIAALKLRVAALTTTVTTLTTAYQELKEQALDAGLTVRSINL